MASGLGGSEGMGRDGEDMASAASGAGGDSTRSVCLLGKVLPLRVSGLSRGPRLHCSAAHRWQWVRTSPGASFSCTHGRKDKL